MASARAYVSHLCSYMDLPRGSNVDPDESYPKITRPNGIWPQGYGYYVEFAVKWKMGYRTYTIHDKEKIKLFSRIARKLEPMTTSAAVSFSMPGSSFEKFVNNLGEFTFDKLVAEIKTPKITVDDKFVSEWENLSHRPGELGAKADIMSDDTIIDIKVCVKDEPSKWLIQCSIYATLAYEKYGYDIKRIFVVNYLNGTSYKLNMSKLPVGWQVAYLKELNSHIDSEISKVLSNRLPTPIASAASAASTPTGDAEPQLQSNDPEPSSPHAHIAKSKSKPVDPPIYIINDIDDIIATPKAKSYRATPATPATPIASTSEYDERVVRITSPNIPLMGRTTSNVSANRNDRTNPSTRKTNEPNINNYENVHTEPYEEPGNSSCCAATLHCFSVCIGAFFECIAECCDLPSPRDRSNGRHKV